MEVTGGVASRPVPVSAANAVELKRISKLPPEEQFLFLVTDELTTNAPVYLHTGEYVVGSITSEVDRLVLRDKYILPIKKSTGVPVVLVVSCFFDGEFPSVIVHGYVPERPVRKYVRGDQYSESPRNTTAVKGYRRDVIPIVEKRCFIDNRIEGEEECVFDACETLEEAGNSCEQAHFLISSGRPTKLWCRFWREKDTK